jgi:hypothetical protein
MLRLHAVLLLSIAALGGCASQRFTYVAPQGVDQKTLEADHRACIEESGITRLGEDQKLLEQQCMMTRGYLMRSTP